MNKTLNRLKNHPGVKELLDVAEEVKGIEKADKVEFALFPK
jgi:hypothetical protein